MTNYKGIAFPFQITGGGSVATSELTTDDYRRVKDSIYQILMTYPGERIMNPEFGCRIKNFIFDNITDITILGMVKYEIETAINKWEPRIQLLDVILTPEISNTEGNKLYIDIYAKIVKFDVEETFSFLIP